MYNGIGLTTPRGSGTNGHVQRNWAFVKPKEKDKTYRTEEELVKLDVVTNRQPNKEILDHERKRRIELKCAEFSEILEEQGFSEETIQNKVNNYRTMLMGHNGKLDGPIDQWGRLSVTETHQLAEAQHEKNARLREAFGISEYFVDGSSFDPDRETKEQLARSEAIQEQERQKALEKEKEKEKPQNNRYELVHTPSPEPPSLDAKKKKAHKTKESSSSEDAKKKRKLKKQKKERLKNKEKKKKGKCKSVSSSSSSDDSSSSSDESDSEDERKKKKLKKKEKKKKKKYSSNDSSHESSPEPSRKKVADKNSAKVKKKVDNIDSSDKHTSRKRERIDDYHSKHSPPPKRSRKKSRSRSRQDRNGELRKSSKIANYRSRSTSPGHIKPNSSYKERDNSVSQNYNQYEPSKKDRYRSRSPEHNKNFEYEKRSKYKERSDSPKYSNKLERPKLNKRPKTPERAHIKREKSPSPSYQKYNSYNSVSTTSVIPDGDHTRSRQKSNRHGTPERRSSEIRRGSPNIHRNNHGSSPVRSNTRSVSKTRDLHSKAKSSDQDCQSIGKDKVLQSSRSTVQCSSEKRSNSRQSDKKPHSPEISPGTKDSHNNQNNDAVITSSKDTRDQPKSREKSPKSKNRQQIPVVRLRSSSEDEKSDHENEHVDEEKEKEQRILRLLKSGLAAKAKESLEKKIPKVKPNVEETKFMNEESSILKTQTLKGTGIVADAFDIKVLPLKTDTVDKLKLENSIKVSASIENVNEFILHKRDHNDSKKSKSISRSRTRSRSISTSKKAKFENSSRSSFRSRSRSSSTSSSSRSVSRSPSRTRIRRTSHSRSLSSSRSSSSRSSRSRSPSIPRRHGSPSFLDRRRITSKRM